MKSGHVLGGFSVLAAGMVVWACGSYIVKGLNAPKPADCPAMQSQAAITQRAAEICTTQLVGCTLTYAEVRAIVAEVEDARVCK